jgi:hypothetical protein
VGFVVDKVALGQVSSEYFGFPCQFSLHRLLHSHHLSSEAGTIGQLVTDIPSGLSLTPPRETKKKKRRGHQISVDIFRILEFKCIMKPQAACRIFLAKYTGFLYSHQIAEF